jgi:hypothetical protein
MSCKEPEDNPFIGTWERTDNPNVRFVFTETVATGYVYGQGLKNDISWTGTYTYDDKQIVVKLNQELSSESMIAGWPNGYICNYEFENDLLRLAPNPFGIPGPPMFFRLVND